MRWKSRFRVRVLDAENTAVVWETGYTILHGRLTALLVDSPSALNVLDIEYGTRQLAQLGYLEEEGTEATREVSGLISPSPFPTGAAAVRLFPMPGVDASAFATLLRSQKITLDTDAPLWLAVTDHYLNPHLEKLNREALNQKIPWLLMKVSGELPSVGPLFRPHETACWECLAARRREMPGYLLLDGPPVFHIDPQPGVPEAMAAATAAELLNPACEILTFTPAVERHTVIRRQHCPACGEPPANPAPLRLTPGPSPSAQEVYARYSHHISPVSGILSRLEQTAPTVFAATHNFALTSGRSPLSRIRRGATSFGKGLSLEQARTSALCESLERYSGCFRGTEPRVTASYDALGAQAIHPNASMLFSDAQYANRDQWNPIEGAFNWVPQRFDAAREVEWAPLWSLTQECFRYLPAAYCYYNYRLPEDHDFCRADSNGNAAGSSLEEAVLHGLYEVVERDAAALWWYNRTRRPAIDPASVGMQPATHPGWKVWALDLTTDFEIPVFAAIAQRANTTEAPVPLGFGAHLDSKVALGRAFAELRQGLSLITDDRPPRVSVGGDHEGAYLWPAETIAAGRSRPISPHNQLAACLDRATRLGLEVMVLDQTRADVGLHVVKVIVPGMRHFWARFAPGRLYMAGRTEAELNPAHLVI